MIRAIVTDIEGTTSSIAFVHDVLFPYARTHLRTFLREHATAPEVRRELEEVARLTGRDLALDETAAVLESWIAEDRKLTPLKSLQGMIWRQGYAAGELKGHVYPDVPEFLRQWHAQGRTLYVYSSGSEEAQRLIFGHTAYGDLTPLFAGFFDTRIGGKREAESYREIVRRIDVPADEVLFLSDIGEELDAARAAGMHTCQLLRDDTTLASAAHPQARSFAGVAL